MSVVDCLAMTEPEPITECDKLRTPESACQPDERSASFVVVNRETGDSRPRILADEHEALAQLVLNDAVPAGVRVHFETAKNLLLYSWFCYRFMQVAELHALGALEMALRRTFSVSDDAKDAPGLAVLLKRALAEGRLGNQGLRHVERLETIAPEPIRHVWVDEGGVHVGDLIVPEAPDVRGYAEMLARELPRHRNTLAHGSELLHPASANLMLELCCDMINLLFTPREVAS